MKFAGLAREQQRAVAGQAVVARDLRHHAHAALRDGIERHLAGQEGHVDLVALDRLLERFVGSDGEHADRPADGAAQVREKRLPVVARFEGAAQRQDAEAQRRRVGGGARAGGLGSSSERARPAAAPVRNARTARPRGVPSSGNARRGRAVEASGATAQWTGDLHLLLRHVGWAAASGLVKAVLSRTQLETNFDQIRDVFL